MHGRPGHKTVIDKNFQERVRCSRHRLLVATSATASRFFLFTLSGLGFCFFLEFLAFFLAQVSRTFHHGRVFLSAYSTLFFCATAACTRTAYFPVGANCAVFFASSAAPGMQGARNRHTHGRHQGRDTEAGEDFFNVLTFHCALLQQMLGRYAPGDLQEDEPTRSCQD